MKQTKKSYAAISERLTNASLRPTRQRVLLGGLLWKGEKCRHVSAEQLHTEAMENNITVSLATVYNTLHQFVDAELMREIVVEGGCSYFDTNTHTHHHFYYEDTGELMDIPAEAISLTKLPTPPKGAKLRSVDVIIRVAHA